MGKDEQPELIITVQIEGPNCTVALEGELDLSSTSRLERALNELPPDADGQVLLDLEGLSFSDAAGLAAIERAARALGNRLIVCGPRPNVREVIELTHMDQRVPVEDHAAAEVSDIPGGNLAYVRLLCQAFQKGGAEELVKIVPKDVRWRPLGVDRDLTTPEFLDYWESQPAVSLTPALMTAVGEDVLVTWNVGNGRPRPSWSICRFRERELVEAVSFDREADAIAALRRERDRSAP